MKLIIAGTRNMIISQQYLTEVINYFNLSPSEIVCGNAKGIDSIGKEWAIANNKILKLFPPDWNKYGKSAGPKRNRQMAEYADALLLIWDGNSPGSQNMRDQMFDIEKPIYEIIMQRLT